VGFILHSELLAKHVCSASYVKAGFHSGLEAKMYKQQNKHYNFLCAIYNVDTVISELEFHNSESGKQLFSTGYHSFYTKNINNEYCNEWLIYCNL